MVTFYFRDRPRRGKTHTQLMNTQVSYQTPKDFMVVIGDSRAKTDKGSDNFTIYARHKTGFVRQLTFIIYRKYQARVNI